ncbi:MAG: glycosyltransferase family 39 protein [Anaerolineaceae bacterium]|nr:glycosyltransferase family 39 protein [Anaerolineaceae bacterium]
MTGLIGSENELTPEQGREVPLNASAAVLEDIGRSRSSLAALLAWLERASDWLVAALVLVFLVCGIATLPQYGLTWDEGLGNLFFGERYFYYLTTFTDKFLDFKANLSVTQKLPLNLFASPYHDHPYLYPPLADTLSAASMHLFSYQLHWLDPVDGFHLVKVLLAALFLWFLYRFASRQLGKLPAFFAVLFLAVFPRFWGDMHFNPKDVPETIFFGLCLMAYIDWYEHPHWVKALGVGLLAGAALAVKVNAVFIPVILILGVWRWDLRNPKTWLAAGKELLRQLHHYVLMALSCLGLYYLSWPYIYGNPLLARTYFSFMATQEGRVGWPGWSWEPLAQVLTTMPEVILVLFLLGLVLVCRQLFKDKAMIWRLLLVWCLLPIFRISLPGMVNFDGIRHFLEFLPAAMLLAGYGAAALIKWISRGRPRWKLALSLMVLLLVGMNTANILANYYPYEYIYYNSLIGGLPGARQAFGPSEVTDYWASSYRQGLQWIDQNAPSDSNLQAPVANWLVQITRKVWLRPDIQLVPADQQESAYKTSSPVYVMFVDRPEFYTNLAKYCTQKLKPVHEIDVDGVPVLWIYLLPKSS